MFILFRSGLSKLDPDAHRNPDEVSLTGNVEISRPYLGQGDITELFKSEVDRSSMVIILS